ncbi:hypothetical protein [Kineococcus sp. SYSU DK005]|uniref:hypothetical protein n=1 Tax=Kineococcus sp. SYSU DK005 TaxID=3383126 RepID=UPI003D7D5639
MSGSRTRTAAVLLLAAAAGCAPAACTSATSPVAPPTPPTPSAPGAAVRAPAAGEPDAAADLRGGDPAVVALREYLRQQALAINARQSDPAALPAFTATLTPAALGWAVPLLAANLGDEMPGPYPVGVLGSTRLGEDRVELQLCLQDRGWQVDRAGGQPLNPAHHARAVAVVVRSGERWLVDDVAGTGEACSADQVREERF